MGEAEKGSMLKQTLKNLCCSNRWSYGIIWRFDQRNSMLLTMEEAYYEEQMRPLVNNILQKFHILGEGIIGQAAFRGKHQWIFSDSHGKNSDYYNGNQITFQDESELQNQFSYGIKTIAIISVERRGVVQVGSTQKILERLNFLDETKKLFYGTGSCHGLTPLEIETCNLDGLFASLGSCGNFYNQNLATELYGFPRELKRWPCSVKNITESSGFMREIRHLSVNSVLQSLSHRRNQSQTSKAEAQIISGKISPANGLAADTPCTSTWSSEGTILASFETSFPSEMGIWDSSNTLPQANNLALSGNMEQNLQAASTFTSFYGIGDLGDAELPTLDSFGKTAEYQRSFGTNSGLLDDAINLERITEEFNLADFTTNFSSSFKLDDLSQLFSPLPQHDVNGVGATITSDVSSSVGVTSVSSALVGGDTLVDIPVRLTANSSQSSMTDTFISNAEKSTIVHDNGNELLDGVGLDFAFEKTGVSLEDIIMPLLHGDNSTVTSGMSETISELDVRAMTTGKRKGLLSELGLEKLLDGVNNSSHVTKSNVEDQLSTIKRRKTESSLSSFCQGQFMGLSYSGGSVNLVHHSHNWDKSNNTILNKEVHRKSQVGAWIDDSYSVNVGQAVAATSKKPAKKRAKPGESTRPRPNDCLLIQDCIKELRAIIPHSGKPLSIDHLLEQTIKYMLFLQGVTKYADKIKQAEEPKIIGNENGLLPKHNMISGAATWAFEVGAQSIPIVVKDLNPPGQMLIEMLCEDQGFFLEIANVIRGIGLNILKGVMELQEDKIWARFIVEINTGVKNSKQCTKIT